MDRRSFLKKAGTTAAIGAAATAALLAGCEKKESTGPAVMKKKAKFSWKLAMSFGITAPVLGTSLPAMADDVRKMTEGGLDIKVFGAGELVPAFGVFDAAKDGSIEMMYSASYYWAGKAPAALFTCSVPFGMNTQQSNAWYYHGGGLDLWKEFYAKHGLIGFPAGNTGTQMGGWFRKEIKSVNDFKGLKMRMPGLGGKVISALGATVVLIPGPDIFASLERGVIDATEWVGPFYDFNLGLHQAAKYYYSPGWHEPGTTNELTFNLKAWESLPDDYKQIMEHAAYKMNVNNLAEFDAKNGEYLNKITDYGVQLRQFPDDVLKGLYNAAEKINQETADSDPDARKVYESYKKFQTDVRAYHEISEVAYHRALKTVGAV